MELVFHCSNHSPVEILALNVVFHVRIFTMKLFMDDCVCIWTLFTFGGKQIRERTADGRDTKARCFHGEDTKRLFGVESVLKVNMHQKKGKWHR